MSSQLPHEILDQIGTSRNHQLLDGCIRFVNPKQLLPILEAGYIRANDAIPFAITAFGDILTWENERYICKVSFCKEKTDILSAGVDYFFDDLDDPEYAEEQFDIEFYRNVREKIGNLSDDECYGFVPLLSLGGIEDIEHIEKVKYMEYLYLIIQSGGCLR